MLENLSQDLRSQFATGKKSVLVWNLASRSQNVTLKISEDALMVGNNKKGSIGHAEDAGSD